MYPFTLVSTGAVVAAFLPRMWQTLLASTGLTLAYGVSMVSFHDTGSAYVINIFIDMLTYVPFAWVARWLAFHARALGLRLDRVQKEAVSRAEQLTRTQEQARYQGQISELRMAAIEAALASERARIAGLTSLHDRILQTLEMLSHAGVLSNARLRAHVAAEARWLRRLVERGGRAEMAATPPCSSHQPADQRH